MSSEGGLGAPLVLEQSFGRYTLVAKVGHGGMAEVFLAAAQGPAGFSKLSVIKRLHPHLEDEDALVGMFLDEARLAARLNHPNVVQTFEVGDVDGLHYLAMEYLEGQSFARVMRRLGREGHRMPLALACRVFSEALHGLEYAHTLEDYDGTPLAVVHRDISPGNLFVTYDGQVKVLDFGIAKAGTQIMETRAGQVKGKFAYIAPEQARSGEHDQRADLWSLGVCMWEAFSGRRLFKGDSEISTLNNALRSDIIRLDSDDGAIPAELAAIVDRALQRDPARRYPSARAIREDLEAFTASAGLRASRSEMGAFVTDLFHRERDEQRAILKAHMAGELEGQVLTPVPRHASGSHSGVVSYPDYAERRTPGKAAIGLVFLLASLVGAMTAWLLHQRDREPVVASPAGVAQPEAPVTVASPDGAPVPLAPPTVTPSSEAPGAPAVDPDPVEAPGAGPEPVVGSVVGAESAPEPEPARVAMAAVMRPRGTSPRRRAPPETMAAEMAPEEPAAASGTGTLTLDTIPWSEVSLGSRVLGTTPLRNVELPEGSHTLTLVNPERGLRTRYQVTIRAGQAVTRRVGLE